MARVFMAFLGTTKYVPVHYKFKDRVSRLTPFVQEALVELLCADWGDGDRLVFFLTEEALNKNWQDGGNFSEGLETRLKKLGLKAEIIPVLVSEGRSEEEIRENFRTVITQLQAEEEVIFDITHSFRSLPMLNLVALNYARALKGIKIKGIYYGAFEVLGPPKEVEEMPEDRRVAPVFDLTSYALLLDWSFAVEELTRYGLAERLYELVKEEITPILKETRGQNERARSLRNLIEELRRLTLAIYTCRCGDIESFKPRALANLREDFLYPFDSLVKKIENKVRPFAGEDPWQKALSAVAWCLEHNLIQQGYTILLEATISEVIRILGFKEVLKIEDRKFVSSLLSVTAQKRPPEEWEGELAERKEEALRIQEAGGKVFEDLARLYHQLDQKRNDINHCGCRKGAQDSWALEREFSKLYKAIQSAIASFRTAFSG